MRTSSPSAARSRPPADGRVAPSAGTPFADLAHAFLPAEAGRRGVVVEGGADALAELPADADVVVWGRPAGAAGPALRQAAARELGLRRLRAALPPRLRVTAVHRLPARAISGGARGRARAALRAGVLVEIASDDAGPRVLDAVARAAGVTRLGSVRAGTGGTLLVRARLSGGTPGVLRVARAGGPGDPAAAAATLERLAVAAVPAIPEPLGRGVVAGASWAAERALPGRRPPRATAALVAEVASVCAALPAAAGPPAAPVDDLLAAAALLPARAVALRALAGDLRPRLAALPGVQRHGDLWTGNLLVDRGRLAGIVDWDAAHPAGVPGADLVQLHGADVRRRARRPLGAAVVARTWRSREFAAATAGYWRALGLAPDAATLDLAGIAWWATEVHHTLARLPHRAADAAWIAANVDAVLGDLSVSPAPPRA
jgi:hypothetical protein